MRNLRFLSFVCLLTVGSLVASANEKEVITTEPGARVEQLESRILEIWRMDLSTLEKSDRIALRHEVKEIKKELKKNDVKLDNKVSISIGAIIIVLLLILIL